MGKRQTFAHGTFQRYKHRGCRCQRCRTAWADYDRDRQRGYREERRGWVMLYLLDHPCADCGNRNPICLEFDHVRGKKSANISKGVNLRWSVERLAREVANCDVVCRNCHAVRTAKRDGHFSTLPADVREAFEARIEELA